MKLFKVILTVLMTLGVQMNANAESKQVVVLDVRTIGEFSEGHVNGALNIDFYAPDFKAQVSKLDKSKTYKVYCRSGNRSGQSVNIMKELGFSKVENLGSLQQAMVTLEKK